MVFSQLVFNLNETWRSGLLGSTSQRGQIGLLLKLSDPAVHDIGIQVVGPRNGGNRDVGLKTFSHNLLFELNRVIDPGFALGLNFHSVYVSTIHNGHKCTKPLIYPQDDITGRT